MPVKRAFGVILILSFLFASCKKDSPEANSIAEFQKTYSQSGNQESNRLITVSDGLVAIGTSTVGSVNHLQLLKTDFSGNTLWKKEFDAESIGFGIKCTSDHNLILTGTTFDGTGDQNVLLAKTDPDGNLIWQKSFGGLLPDQGKDVIELENGELMLVGSTQNFGPGVVAMYVIKTDMGGNEVWSRTFGGDGLDGGSELLQINGNEVMLLGFAGSFGAGNRDVYLQTVSLDGDSLWSTTIGGAGYEESQAIARTSDGGYIMSNHSASEEPNHSLLATKLDMNGAVEWEHHFGTQTAHEGGEGALADSEGNYLFLGRTNSFGNDEQVYFIKTDGLGNVLEELNFGSEGDQRGNDVIEHHGSYYICGTSTVNGVADILLIKKPM